MEIEGYNFPDELWYDKNHFWARIEGDTVVMGTTDFAQKLAGEIGYVELPEVGQKVTAGQTFRFHRIRQMGGADLCRLFRSGDGGQRGPGG